jgi:hypothetical protein
MRFRTVTTRLAALIVLFVSAADYWMYDRADPTAPMNAASEGTAAMVRQSVLAAALQTIDAPDDHCLWCSPSIAARPPVLPRSDAISFMSRAIGVSFQSFDPARIEQPPEA